MVKSLVNKFGRLRVLGYTSGSGNTAWAALEQERELNKTFEGCPYEIVGIFSDNPESKSVSKAIEHGIPYVALSIRDFYKERNKPLNDMEVRREYDKAARNLFENFKPDIIMLAGYVWAVSEEITKRYLMLNCHPGDLTLEKEGNRILAGANGIKSAFEHELMELRASAHLVTSEVDGGPVLVTSPPINVDYSLHADGEERFRYYLKLVNEQSRLVGAWALLEIASESFQIDDEGKLLYKEIPVSHGIKLESWDQYRSSAKINKSKMFSPKSIVVIGASNKDGIGKAVINNIINGGFNGKVYAVNVRGESVGEVPGYKSVMDIEEEVEMAVIALPSRFALNVIEECGRKGVTAINCVAAGFKETGDEGKKLEDEIMKVVYKYSMRMTGPNCMGTINTAEGVSMNATILGTTLKKGNVAMVTQSGALAAAFTDLADELAVGYSHIISLGNQADINVCDCLSELETDENTRVILLYLETINDYKRFRNIVSKMKTPIIVLKSGRTSVGASAASSHTGSMVGNDDIVDALISQSGAIRVESLEDAYLLAMTLSKVDFPKGNRVGIVTNTGGIGILATDALIDNGFDLPNLPEEVSKELKDHLYPEASANNPVDLIAAAPSNHYNIALRMMSNTGLYDSIIVTCVPPATVNTKQVAEAIIETLRDLNLPVMTCFLESAVNGGAKEVFRKGNIPTFDYPEKMADILGYMKRETPSLNFVDNNISMDKNFEVKNILENNKGKYLTISDAQYVLENYGIKMALSGYVKNIEDIDKLNLSYPIVAKIDHPEIIHKSDVGGVQLDIKDTNELEKLFYEWNKKFKGLEGIFVQEQISGKHEIIIGAVSDSVAGHGLIIGAGGILVEVLKDISYGHVPVSEDTANDMISDLKISKLLEGHRGEEPVDLELLKSVLLKVNNLILDHNNIEELDINPLVYSIDKDCFIGLDARIKVCK